MTLQSAAILNYNYKECINSTILSQISTYLPRVNPALTGWKKTPVTIHTLIPYIYVDNDMCHCNLDTPNTLVPCCTSIAIP